MSLRSPLSLVVLLFSLTCLADDPVFSGPQVGEPLVPFQVVSVYGDDAGKEVDPIDAAAGKPTLLVFVHKLTRPGMALSRGLTAYAKGKEGVETGIVWLDDDKAKAEDYLRRAKKSLNFIVPVGVSVDGGEGPGAYGLNRNVELTILVAQDNKVTANFALVQPSVTEGPQIAGELAKLVSQDPPTVEEFQKLAYPGGGMKRNMRKKPNDPPAAAGDLRSMMRQVIAADASETGLRDAVKAIEQWVGDNKGRQTQLGRMSSAVLERGMGSEPAQEVIKEWREKYGSDKNESRK